MNEIELTQDVVGFTGMPVEVPYKCSAAFWNRIIGTEFKFPNGGIAEALQPILDYTANYDMLRGIRFFPIHTEIRLSGKMGEKLVQQTKPQED